MTISLADPGPHRPYRNRQFDEAAKQFNEALASADLKLQGLAYYNRGNTLFHLGERANDPSKRSEAWEKSIKDYESSLKLDPQDADAKFNREYVKQLLEELKKEQQQQQKSPPQNLEPRGDTKQSHPELWFP
jgi:Ca-activated chloride channel family protein